MEIRDALAVTLDAQAASGDDEVSVAQRRLNRAYDSLRGPVRAAQPVRVARTGRADPATGEELMRRSVPAMGGFRRSTPTTRRAGPRGLRRRHPDRAQSLGVHPPGGRARPPTPRRRDRRRRTGGLPGHRPGGPGPGRRPARRRHATAPGRAGRPGLGRPGHRGAGPRRPVPVGRRAGQAGRGRDRRRARPGVRGQTSPPSKPSNPPTSAPPRSTPVSAPRGSTPTTSPLSPARSSTATPSSSSTSRSPPPGRWRRRPWQPRTVAMTTEWGTGRADALHLVEALCDQRAGTVYRRARRRPAGPQRRPPPSPPGRSRKPSSDRFAAWVWEDPERADRLAGALQPAVQLRRPPRLSTALTSACPAWPPTSPPAPISATRCGGSCPNRTCCSPTPWAPAKPPPW